MENREHQEKRLRPSDLEDLEGLVDLAEKVSANAREIEEKLFNTRLRLWASVILVSISFLFGVKNATDAMTAALNGDSPGTLSVLWMAATATASALMLFYMFIVVRDKHKLFADLQTESQILRKLLEMIHPLKESMSVHTAETVSAAILDMRLRRIQFSTRVSPDRAGPKVRDLAFSGQEA